MDIRDIFDELIRWTPFLAGGFALNIAIGVVAMLLGTAIGAMLAFMRTARGKLVAMPGDYLTRTSGNVPAFVFLFYVAYLVPPEVSLFGLQVAMPAWLKAALALSVMVVGHVSDGLTAAIGDWRRGQRETALLLLPDWGKGLGLVIVSSSMASVIGAGEIVSRCGTVVAATGNLSLLIWIYLYAMTWFFAVCYPLMRTMNWLKNRLRYMGWQSQLH